MRKKTNIICILWGQKYTEIDVNRLFGMIQRNTSHDIDFHLFSDEALPDLHPAIIRHPEPAKNEAIYHASYNYRKEAALCDNSLGDLSGQRVFFFDLDVVIMDNLDDLFSYPEGDQFYIINDWNSRGNKVGQATCYSFVVGTLGYVKDYFEANPEAIIKEFGTASQEYLSKQVIKEFGKLNFWPESWCQSFRFHCLPWGFLRHLKIPRKPSSETKVLAFHGHPDLNDAIHGTWGKPGDRKAAHGWKKLYKRCLPTPWVSELWKD
jgi:hypothetical protein